MTPAEVVRARIFDAHLDRMRAVADRLLGKGPDSERAVRQARRQVAGHHPVPGRLGDGAGPAGPDDMRHWLTLVVGRVCAERLCRRVSSGSATVSGQATADREEPTGEPDAPSDDVTLAVLVVLESLTPAQRIAFVMHDVLGVPVAHLASVLGRDVASTRQLLKGARCRVRLGAQTPRTGAGSSWLLAADLLAAARAGDHRAVARLLHPDVVLRLARPGAAATLLVVNGTDQVARRAAVQGARLDARCHLAMVDGSVGIVAVGDTGTMATARLSVTEGLVSGIDVVLRPGSARRRAR